MYWSARAAPVSVPHGARSLLWEDVELNGHSDFYRPQKSNTVLSLTIGHSLTVIFILNRHHSILLIMSAATFASTLNLNKLYDLKGRVALVTGGGTGIGLMIASSLAANGAKVYIASRRVEVLQKVAEDWKAQGQTVIPCV